MKTSAFLSDLRVVSANSTLCGCYRTRIGRDLIHPSIPNLHILLSQPPNLETRNLLKGVRIKALNEGKDGRDYLAIQSTHITRTCRTQQDI